MTIEQDRLPLSQAADRLAELLAGDHLGNEPAVVIHDLGRMRDRIAALSAAFGQHTLHALAIKANPLVAVLERAHETGAGLEAASIEEVELALAAGCPADRIVFDSPAKTTEEITRALELGLVINCDSYPELDRVGRLYRDGSGARIGLRINTQVGRGAIATTSVAGSRSKFGVPLEDAAAILSAFERFPWLQGLHAHVGSQGCDCDLLVESASRLIALRHQIHERLGSDRVHTVDIGGGLPVAYRSQTQAPTLQSYVGALRDRVPQLFDGSVRVITEFGRWIQASCGLAYSRIEYVKDAGRLAICHLGADLFLRFVYHPQDWSHELFVLDGRGRLKQGEPRPVSIAGPLCFGGDFLVRDVALPRIEPGDWIGVRDVGAYTLSMWSRHCNRGIPLVLGVDDEGPEPVTVLRKRETPADVAAFWSTTPCFNT